eukprot:scaffold296668_cov17-Tisochrysis_lutea.AAC.1
MHRPDTQPAQIQDASTACSSYYLHTLIKACQKLRPYPASNASRDAKVFFDHKEIYKQCAQAIAPLLKSCGIRAPHPSVQEDRTHVPHVSKLAQRREFESRGGPGIPEDALEPGSTDLLQYNN